MPTKRKNDDVNINDDTNPNKKQTTRTIATFDKTIDILDKLNRNVVGTTTVKNLHEGLYWPECVEQPNQLNESACVYWLHSCHNDNMAINVAIIYLLLSKYNLYQKEISKIYIKHKLQTLTQDDDYEDDKGHPLFDYLLFIFLETTYSTKQYLDILFKYINGDSELVTTLPIWFNKQNIDPEQCIKWFNKQKKIFCNNSYSTHAIHKFIGVYILLHSNIGFHNQDILDNLLESFNRFIIECITNQTDDTDTFKICMRLNDYLVSTGLNKIDFDNITSILSDTGEQI